MDFFNAIFQGIIQGLTEFLPVSSSGHLAIYQHITGMQENNLFFSVMLHIGTLSAVLAIYFKTVLKLFSSLISIFKKLIHRDFVWKDMTPEENLAMMIIIGLIPLFLLFIPIPMTDMKVKDIADKFALDGYFLAVGIALLGTSTLLLLGDSKKPDIKIINGKKIQKENEKKISCSGCNNSRRDTMLCSYLPRSVTFRLNTCRKSAQGYQQTDCS